jgi:hemolysin III
MPIASSEFPVYTTAEKAVDAVVHVLGLAGASIGLAFLVARTGPATTDSEYVALFVYALGLVGMLSASALYNLTSAGRLKAVFRRLDHAMIFVMIAGSYTPIAVSALRPGLGVPLCITIWAMAAFGIGLRLAWGRIYERISLGLYLGMGWLVLAVMPPLAMTVSWQVLGLLIVGGILYSLGSVVHTRKKLLFHNAAWHAMIVIAAGLHMAAIAHLLT